jgi:acetylglutamate kinase
MISIVEKTDTLIEALPYIQRYERKTFVIKYGGAAMIDESLREGFAQDVTILKKIGINIVVVHGGGKEVTETASALGIESRFINGQRYTDEKMMDVVQMVLAGKTNKEIVARINLHNGGAVGVCGIDAGLLRVNKSEPDGVDLGRVGEITAVNTEFLSLLIQHDIMPVVAPIGVDEGWQSYNINADVAAAAVAGALRAEKLVYLSDVKGVMIGDKFIPSLRQQEAEKYIKDGVIAGGMIPKVQSAFNALNAGVNKVHMIDGRVPHSMLAEIFTDEGIGTEVTHSEET